VTPAPSTSPRQVGQSAAQAAAANTTMTGGNGNVFMAVVLTQRTRIGSTFFDLDYSPFALPA